MLTRTLALTLFAAGLLVISAPPRLAAEDADLRVQAAKALRKAVTFFRTQVATEGGYLWRYSADLTKREGEGKATPTQVWVQPPGTPAVGLAYLTAYEATGDPYYLDAAREAANVLLRGQLRSGGWTNRIELDPAGRKQFAYRVDKESGPRARNVTSLDDNMTQSAVRFLMRFDRATGFKEAQVHEAAAYALTSLLKAQYPNGAWPQGYDRFPDPAQFPVKKASYPERWSRTPTGGPYWTYYTLNDNVLADMVETMLEAERTYNEPKYRTAAEKAGGFLILAQMPDPQPAWAQQYNADMHPAWARRFEPPAITGGESQRAMRILLLLYRETGDKKYLEPVPKALDYLRKSRLPDGRLARFYELKTNKPLYFTRDYQLTYDDKNVPTHYAFKVPDNLDAIAREYEQLQKLDPGQLKRPAQPARPELTRRLTERTKAVLAALDDRGAWVEDGRLRFHGGNDPTRRIISCQTFIDNVETLSAYLAATRP
jgi:PelA/Pel-15E family pectate lyase